MTTDSTTHDLPPEVLDKIFDLVDPIDTYAIPLLAKSWHPSGTIKLYREVEPDSLASMKALQATISENNHYANLVTTLIFPVFRLVDPIPAELEYGPLYLHSRRGSKHSHRNPPQPKGSSVARGWLDHDGIWIQSRSVPINLDADGLDAIVVLFHKIIQKCPNLEVLHAPVWQSNAEFPQSITLSRLRTLILLSPCKGVGSTPLLSSSCNIQTVENIHLVHGDDSLLTAIFKHPFPAIKSLSLDGGKYDVRKAVRFIQKFRHSAIFWNCFLNGGLREKAFLFQALLINHDKLGINISYLSAGFGTPDTIKERLTKLTISTLASGLKNEYTPRLQKLSIDLLPRTLESIEFVVHEEHDSRHFAANLAQEVRFLERKLLPRCQDLKVIGFKLLGTEASPSWHLYAVTYTMISAKLRQDHGIQLQVSYQPLKRLFNKHAERKHLMWWHPSSPMDAIIANFLLTDK